MSLLKQREKPCERACSPAPCVGFGGLSTLLFLLLAGEASARMAGLPMVPTDTLLALPLVFAAAATAEQRGWLQHPAAVPCRYISYTLLFFLFGTLLPARFCSFCLLPLGFLSATHILSRDLQRRLMVSIAMAQACAAPAFFCRLDKISFDLFVEPRIWALAAYLFFAEDDARHRTPENGKPICSQQARCLGILFIAQFCCIDMLTADAFPASDICLLSACGGTLLQTGLRRRAAPAGTALQKLLQAPLLPASIAALFGIFIGRLFF